MRTNHGGEIFEGVRLELPATVGRDVFWTAEPRDPPRYQGRCAGLGGDLGQRVNLRPSRVAVDDGEAVPVPRTKIKWPYQVKVDMPKPS